MASLYKQKRSKNWWIKYTANGRTIRRSLRTDNNKIAREILFEYQYKENQGLLGSNSRVLIETILPEYLRNKATTKTKKSAATDASRLNRFFAQSKVKRLSQVTPQIIEQFMTSMIETGRSPKTANEYRLALSGLFNWAIRTKGWRPESGHWTNPVEHVRALRTSAPEIVYLTKQEISQQIAAYSQNSQLQAMIATMIYGGLRRSEVLWLTQDDVVLKNDPPLLIVRAKTINGTFWQPKTRKNRSVPISSKLQTILKGFSKPEELSRWFFPSPNGTRWDPDNFSQHLRTNQEKRDFKWTSLHFRHTFGSQLAQRGISLYKIAELMGNSPDICRKHYAALRTEDMADIVEF